MTHKKILVYQKNRPSDLRTYNLTNEFSQLKINNPGYLCPFGVGLKVVNMLKEGAAGLTTCRRLTV